MKFVPNVLINNILALVQIMAWRQPDDKPLSEPMMVLEITDTYMHHPASRGVTIRRATIRYVSRYVGRDTTNDTISDETPTN